MLIDSRTTDKLLSLVRKERERQDSKWGEQSHPNGTSTEHWTKYADSMKKANDHDELNKQANWTNILLEEVYEALAEEDRYKLRQELIEVAAVCLVWIQDLDKNAEL